MQHQQQQQSLRRKSCRACVQGKRRCDLRVPRCRRCDMTSKDCVYPRATGSSASPAAIEDRSPLSPEVSSSEAPVSSLLVDPTWDIADVSMSLPSTLHVAPWSTLTTSSMDRSPVVSSSVSALNAAATISNLQARIEYVAGRIATQAAVLVETGHNVFIHRAQVLASSALRDALSASALYAVRNKANAAIVDAEIAQRASQLTEAVESALVHWPLVQVDLLPPVQALVIYQVLRLFAGCGSIAQRARADADAVILRSCLSKLYLKLKHVSRDATSTQSWEQWIEEESIRRTIVFVETMQGVLVFLRQQWDGVTQCLHDLEFTAQIALWEAESAVEWRSAGKSSLALPVNIASYQRDLIEATPTDLDDLGVMLRGMCDGLESLENWLGGNRKVLQKWGLRSPGNLTVLCS